MKASYFKLHAQEYYQKHFVLLFLVIFALYVFAAITYQSQLYGDPVWWFQRVLEKQDYFLPISFRPFPFYLHQTPLVIALRGGLTDINTLLFLYGLGTYLSVFVALSWSLVFFRALRWTSFLVTISFIVFGSWLGGLAYSFEYNAFLNLLPTFVLPILCLGKKPWLALIAFPISSLMLIGSYEMGVVFGLLFLAMLAHNAWIHRHRDIAAIQKLAYASGFVSASYLTVQSFFNLKVALSALPDNLPVAITELREIAGHFLFWFGLAAIVLLTFATIFPSPKRLKLTVWMLSIFAAISFLAIVLYPPAPDLGFATRIAAIILSFILISYWGMFGFRFETDSHVRFSFVFALLLGLFLNLVVHGTSLVGWNRYRIAFTAALSSTNEAIVPLDQAGLRDRHGLGKFTWSWMQESLSLFWSANGQVSSLMQRSGLAPEIAFDIYDPQSIPDLRKFGINTTPYLQKLMAGQVTRGNP